MGKENYQAKLLARVAEVHRLEEEIANLKQHLYLEKVQVDKMMELVAQF